jgi:hypothetical protein
MFQYNAVNKRCLQTLFYRQKADKAHLITDSITEMTEDAILAGDKRYLVDLVVFATGFEPIKSICGFRTEGRNGAVLYDQVISTIKSFDDFQLYH